MNNEQLNEGIREVVLALLSMAANTYTIDYVWNQLERRPEPIEQKVKALEIVDKKPTTKDFDKTVDKLLNYYQKKVKVKLPPKPYPNLKKSETNDRSTLINFIKKHEDFSPIPYWDYKQYSIGYGTKALPNDKQISKSEAIERLKKEVEKHRNVVVKAGEKWGYDWTPQQIDALTSFRYNVGSIGALTANGTRDNKTISRKILEYTKAGKKTLPGLETRRKDEHIMFSSRI